MEAKRILRVFPRFVSGTVGIGLNMVVWVAWFFDYRGTCHVVSLIALAFWMGAAFRDLTANTTEQARAGSASPDYDGSEVIR